MLTSSSEAKFLQEMSGSVSVAALGSPLGFVLLNSNAGWKVYLSLAPSGAVSASRGVRSDEISPSKLLDAVFDAL
jgi:hypothetical protein